MATTHANINQFYESKEDKVQFFPLESYIDSSRADHEEEPEEPEEPEAEAEEAGEVTLAEVREKGEGEEIGLGEVGASADDVAVEGDNVRNEGAGQESSCRHQRRARDRRLPWLPPVPQFNSIVHPTALHEQHTRYPIGFDVQGGALAFSSSFLIRQFSNNS